MQFKSIVFTFALLSTVVLHAADIPPVPAENGVGFFIHDYANLLDEVATKRIKEAQQRAFEEHNTPIIVVTIPSMSRYNHDGSIESLATEWFNHWRIGTEDLENGANQGVLLLVSVGDRKARIELGGDWGRHWDAYCQRVMDRDIIPFFKQQHYGRGIANGVESLSSMAAAGPNGSTPQLEVREPAGDSGQPGGGLSGLAMCCMWPLLLLMSLWSAVTGRSGSGGYSGGSGFSGGGFSGGSSGGGGATGSW